MKRKDVKIVNRFGKKRRLLFALAFLIGISALSFVFLSASIPDQYLVAEGESTSGLIRLPFVEEEFLEADSQPSSNIPSGKVKIRYSLLGVIPIKNVDVTVIPRTRVYAGGTPVGIYMKTRGILVVGTGAVEKTDGDEKGRAGQRGGRFRRGACGPEGRAGRKSHGASGSACP